METITKSLTKQISGEVILPQDSNYQEARTIYNAMIDKQPAVIVKCKNVEDVIAAVNFARKNKLEVSIRSGGHSGPGLALVENGLVIDLSLMKGIQVDQKNKAVRVEAGCTWGEVDKATHEFGLATVSGVVSTTGVGGLTLGGGHGYLTRKYGLTIDNLIGAEVVLADGKIVHTNKEEIRICSGHCGVEVATLELLLHLSIGFIPLPMWWLGRCSGRSSNLKPP